MAPTPALIAACITFVLVSGCTTTPSNLPPVSSSPTSSASTTVPSGSPSVTPSPTWSADQQAAITAVDAYRAAIHQIEEDPARFSESQMKSILKEVAGGEVVTANAASYLSLKKRGFRYDGDTTVLSTIAGKPSQASYGTEVIVTRCIDQRGLRVLDKAGREVSDADLGYSVSNFNLRQYTVVKRTGSNTFLVYGLAPTKGECGP